MINLGFVATFSAQSSLDIWAFYDGPYRTCHFFFFFFFFFYRVVKSKYCAINGIYRPINVKLSRDKLLGLT